MAILVSQNNDTVAMLVSQTNPVGVELFSYANAFFCSNKLAYIDDGQVSENTLYDVSREKVNFVSRGSQCFPWLHQSSDDLLYSWKF